MLPIMSGIYKEKINCVSNSMDNEYFYLLKFNINALKELWKVFDVILLPQSNNGKLSC